MTDAPEPATNVLHGVSVIGTAEAERGPAQRTALGLATACFGLVIFGLGIADLLRKDPLDALRNQVLDRAATLSTGLDRNWLSSSPPPLPKHPVPPAMLANWQKVPQLMFLCELNEVLLRALWQPGTGLTHIAGPDAPREFFVFRTPDGGPNPRFRYPPSTTLPDGLSTNKFGFRSPDLTVDKPARTIRIACVGASTTVDSHHFPYSYPELLPHWLDLWAAEKGLDLHFEVINAGREALQSNDLRAIVQYEVLPFAVDYVIYYEGANQCGLTEMLRHVQVQGEFTAATPPPTVATELPALFATTSKPLATLRQHSVNTKRMLSLLGAGRDVAEPNKPAQQLSLPAGLDEFGPDITRASEVMQLGPILTDLDAIQKLCAAANAQLVLCSFCWLIADDLRLDLAEGHSAFAHLNGRFWPLRYEMVRRLTDLQNRFFANWAKARSVPFFDLAAQLPRDPLLYVDAVHNTELGSRLHAWLVFAGLTQQIEKDLLRGVVPVPDTHPDPEHPFLKPARHLTADELDRR